MDLNVRDIQGKVIGTIEVRDDVFGLPMNTAPVHQVMVGQLANARQGTASTKTRARVSGGGAKPRPQKHTGRARQGTIRAPQWRGGGVVFGPGPRSYRHHTPRRMRRLALLTMLSDKVRSEELVVLEKLELDQPKTSALLKVLNDVASRWPVLLVADGSDPLVLRCGRNIPRLKMLPASLLNTLDLLNHRRVVMTVAAVRKAEELWGGPFVRFKHRAAPAGIEQ